MKSVFTIHLAFPVPDLFPNRAKGRHWGAMYKAKTEATAASFVLTKAQAKGWTATDKELRLTVTFVMPDKRKRDADNCLAAAKSALDGVAQALKVDDFQFQPVQVFRRFGEKPGAMIVEIERGEE
jgi:Holliday junction resolvase RusA-like endonuclease